MNKEVPNQTNSNEEVDLIKLLDYFKAGIKSLFRKFWKLIELLLKFIVLLKKNWTIVVGLTVIGAAYGFYIHSFTKSENLDYEMVVRSNSIGNLELYAISSEVNNKDAFDHKDDVVDMFKKLGIKKISVEPIEREEDVLNSYFDQIDRAIMRNDLTDTLYYQAYKINSHKDKMAKQDYSLQKVKIKIKQGASPDKVQDDFLNYLNNLNGVKSERENQLAILKTYERVLKQNLDNIDSIMISRAVLNNNSGLVGAEQMLVNTASRGNVEADLLRYTETLSKKLYGTQGKIAEYEKGISVISNLRLINERGTIDNPILKYSILAFVLALVVVLLIQFNKYLKRYESL